MPILLKGINLLLIRDPIVRSALQEIVALMENASEANFGDFESRGAERGLVMKDNQGRKWRVRITVSGETKGGGEIQISAGGVATAARDSGAKGTLIIKVDDIGY